MKEQLATNSSPALSEEDVSAIEQAGLKGQVQRKYMANVFE